MRFVSAVPYDSTGPSVARGFVKLFAADVGLDGAAGVFSVIVSELVTNAIVHGAGPLQVMLNYQDGEVTIEVTDGDSHTERVKPRADGAAPGGRGLRIVASLADRWGTRPSPYGKTVWAIRQTSRA